MLNPPTSAVFCFLLNRFHFLRDKSFATGLVSATRASLCEILATRLLRDYADSPIAIANVVTTAWPVFSGAGRDVLDKADQDNDLDPDETVGNAIEMAILSSAKRFIKSQACQKVIGKVLFK